MHIARFLNEVMKKHEPFCKISAMGLHRTVQKKRAQFAFTLLSISELGVRQPLMNRLCGEATLPWDH